MADERLQELRRAWAEGDLETQVRLLRERVRIGASTEELVRLAAWLGDTAAQALSPSPVEQPGDARELLARLRVHGWDALIRAQLAIARAAFEEAGGEPTAQQLEGVQAAERWLGKPCERHAEAGRLAWKALSKERSSVSFAALVPSRAVFLAWTYSTSTEVDTAQRVSANQTMMLIRDLERAGQPFASLRASICAELVPWALGLRDPVAERVAAHEAAEE